MSDSDRLDLRVQEREKLLNAIVNLLKADRRVVAAWLGGSLGRGTADRLSDLDMYVVISEQYARFVYSSTKEFVSRVPGLLLTEYVPRNAPPDGAYLLSLFHGDTGPHQVDWYWLTDRLEEIPINSKILINSARIPAADMQLPTMADDAFGVDNEIARFWALIGIAAKKVARGHHWSSIALLGYLRSCLDQISWRLGVRDTVPCHADIRSDSPPVDSADQLDAIVAFINEIKDLSPVIIAAGLTSPQIMAGEMAPLIELARTVIAEV